jgi:hypothetical protein
MAKRVRSGGRPVPRRVPPKRPAGAAPSPSRPVAPQPAPALDGEILEPMVGPDDMPRAASGHLTDAELQRAEELQAELAAQERAAMAEQIRRRSRARAGAHDLEDVNAPLRVRAAHEYAYVARDVRRIVITGAVMVAILALVDIAVNVLGLLTL